MKNVSTFVTLYIRGHSNDDVRSMISFKDLRQVINRDFEFHWLEQIFYFAFDVIDFDNVSPLGLAFLRCKSSYP